MFAGVHNKRFSLFHSPIHGLGIRVLQEIPAGEIVMEYTGECIRPTVADARERRYQSKAQNKQVTAKRCRLYVFSAQLMKDHCPILLCIQTTYFFDMDENTVLDGTHRGSLMRFVNHSCEPNCEARILNIPNSGATNGAPGASSATCMRVVLVSLRRLLPGEEISYGAHNSRRPIIIYTQHDY